MSMIESEIDRAVRRFTRDLRPGNLIVEEPEPAYARKRKSVPPRERRIITVRYVSGPETLVRRGQRERVLYVRGTVPHPEEPGRKIHVQLIASRYQQWNVIA